MWKEDGEEDIGEYKSEQMIKLKSQQATAAGRTTEPEPSKHSTTFHKLI